MRIYPVSGQRGSIALIIFFFRKTDGERGKFLRGLLCCSHSGNCRINAAGEKNTAWYIGKQAFVKLVTSKDSSGNTTYSYKQRYLKIIGHKDSYAETYARYEYYTFEAIK